MPAIFFRFKGDSTSVAAAAAAVIIGFGALFFPCKDVVPRPAPSFALGFLAALLVLPLPLPLTLLLALVVLVLVLVLLLAL
jgi:hypothetical protein